jgi:exosortase/archaeosortase
MTAILLLFIYLFYTTGFNELLKINTLLQHYYETQKNDKALTFYHFLVMHYITDDLNDKDNDRDKQLPFKSLETVISNSTVLYIPYLNIQPLSAQSFTVSKSIKLITKDLFIDTDFKSIVWHPPKYS